LRVNSLHETYRRGTKEKGPEKNTGPFIIEAPCSKLQGIFDPQGRSFILIARYALAPGFKMLVFFGQPGGLLC
jgi:hypothetical protein